MSTTDNNTVFVDTLVGSDFLGQPMNKNASFQTIQAAIAAILPMASNSNPWIIYINAGTYATGNNITIYDGMMLTGNNNNTCIINDTITIDPGVLGNCGCDTLLINNVTVNGVTFTNPTGLVNFKNCTVNGQQTYTNLTNIRINYYTCIFNFVFSNTLTYLFSVYGISGSASFNGPNIAVHKSELALYNVTAGISNLYVIDVGTNANCRMIFASNNWIFQFASNPTNLDVIIVQGSTTGVGGVKMAGEVMLFQNTTAVSNSGNINLVHVQSQTTMRLMIDACSIDTLLGRFSTAQYAQTDAAFNLIRLDDCEFTAPFTGTLYSAQTGTLLYDIIDGNASSWSNGASSLGVVVQNVNANYTVGATDSVVLCTPGLLTTITVTLPAATSSNASRVVYVVNMGAATGGVNLANTSGVTSVGLNNKVMCVSTGSVWQAFN